MRRRRSISDTDCPVRLGCRDFVSSLNLPPVSSVRELHPFVEEFIGQPIRLEPAKVGASVPCGMWISTADESYVFYDPATSTAHQDHIIGHEYAHMLKRHRGSTTLPVPAAGDLLGLLDPNLVAAVLGRTDYSEHDEQEAELVGSFLQAHVNSYVPPARSEEADRITRSLLRRD